MASQHDDLIRRVKQLSQQPADADRPASALKQDLDRNIRVAMSVLGQGGSGPIGQLMYSLNQANQDIDRLSGSLRQTRSAADEFAKHLENLR